MKKITSNFENKTYWVQSEVENSPYDEMHQLSIYPNCTGQKIKGFGGAFTEAAGYCFKKLDEDKQNEFLQAYFGENGLRYNIGRTHMNSCDFSLGNYACAESESDEFSMARDHEYILPLIEKAQNVKGEKIALLLSPWSPSAFMKTNGQMNKGGKLKPEYRKLWAEQIAKYIKGYNENGCNVCMVSVQNEPAAVQTWDSCVYSAREEAEFATEFLRPELDKVGLENIGILIWDHNKERLLRRATESMSVSGAENAISGFAFHWYSGDHFEALDLTGQLFFDKELWFTEGCVEYSRFGDSKGADKAKMYAHDILGNLAHGTCANIDWNLLLDEKGGPNHVGNFCEAPIMLDGKGGFIINPSYYAIGHFSRYIKAGAVKLGSSIYDSRLESVVFQNPDGTKVAVILSRADKTLPLWVTLDGETGFKTEIEAGTLTTLIF